MDWKCFRGLSSLHHLLGILRNPKRIHGIFHLQQLCLTFILSKHAQGVTVADLDNDGDPDIITASSGDNTIAVFKNINKGTFCEIKEVVDSNAKGET